MEICLATVSAQSALTFSTSTCFLHERMARLVRFTFHALSKTRASENTVRAWAELSSFGVMILSSYLLSNRVSLRFI